MSFDAIGGDYAKIAIFVVIAGIVILVGVNVTADLTTSTTETASQSIASLTAGDSTGGTVAANANDDTPGTYWEDTA